MQAQQHSVLKCEHITTSRQSSERLVNFRRKICLSHFRMYFQVQWFVIHKLLHKRGSWRVFPWNIYLRLQRKQTSGKTFWLYTTYIPLTRNPSCYHTVNGVIVCLCALLHNTWRRKIEYIFERCIYKVHSRTT